MLLELSETHPKVIVGTNNIINKIEVKLLLSEGILMEVLSLFLPFTHSLYISLKIQTIELKNGN